ncbi:MAG: HAD-IC family P-type ATPase, partial [Nitrosospira sp.]
TKGAPQVILDLSANAGEIKPAVDKAVNDFAARGFRALGVARTDGDGKWQLLGVLPLLDPPREDAKSTVATAAEMGVKIKMVTGDALAIARETAKTLGMGTNILDGATLGDSKTKETAAVTKSIEDADGFAQVFPEHKFHIVDVLQQRGHIVGMTGDGVNDAPALKKADCGFAVSGATDAARAAAAIVLVAPGLSVIIDALKESRKIFQRMNSYAIYRIAETLRVLLFMTLAIVVFNFYPLTAIMIVMLALLNDGAILSIAYDNVRYRNQPEAWNMRTVLTIATVLGVTGVVAAFLLFYLGKQILHLPDPQLQTLMYLKLSVAGHLTIFQTRTRGPWWSTRPAWILLGAVLGTQVVATLIAVYGFSLVTPLGWEYAGMVWGYALAWFLVTDPVKLIAYKVLDRIKADAKPESKTTPALAADAKEQPEAKAEPKPDDAKPQPVAKDEPKSDPKAVAQPETEATPPPTAKTEAPADLKPQIAARAYEIYEQQDHRDGQSVQNWNKAEREIRKNQTEAAPQPETKAEPKPEAKGKPQPEAKDEPKTNVKSEATPEAKAKPKPGTEAKPPTDVSPQLVERVHKLYEELGRQDVQAVEDLENAQREGGKDEPDK